MASKALNVDRYIDTAVEKQLGTQVLAAKASVDASNVPAERIDKAFSAVSNCLNKMIRNDSSQLQTVTERAKQIQSSISQLSGVKALFSSSCRAMRNALKDSLSAEEYMIDSYRQHLTYLKKANAAMNNLANNLKTNDKICFQRITKSYDSIKHINHDLHA